MKSLKRFCIVAVFTTPFLLTACMDNDVYDPSKIKPAEPTKNPFGEDITVPEGFSWSIINSVNLNVEVKDDFQGQYQYLIEVFTANPLPIESATPFAAGYANQNTSYTTKIDIPKTVTRLFIRQTDPNQRKEVYEYAVPQNGGTLNCRLYHVASATRTMTRGTGHGGTSGWDEITDPGYTEETYTIPSVSAPIISGNQLESGSAFVIKPGEIHSGVLHSYNGANATVYVQGTWDVTGIQIAPQGIDIIVLNGGKIYSRSGTFMISDKSSLTVQNGGTVDCDNFNTAANVVVKNFGNIHAQRVEGGNGFNTGTTLYNAEDANFQVDGKFQITDACIYNHGTIRLDSEKGYLISNNSINCLIANYTEATIKGNTMEGGATIVNSGLIEVNTLIDNNSSDALYNNCMLVVRSTFKFRHVVLDKGSITGGKVDETNEWLPVPCIESQTDAKFTLIDGSMIKAKKFDVLSGNVVFKATNQNNTDKSMIKVEEYLKFHEPTHAQLLGNLVVEGTIKGTENPYNQLQANESVNTGFDESKYTIETCGGIFNEGDEGLPPSDPTIPVEIEDGATYTYAFEDQWPVYGDFDMNDLVISIDKKSLTTQDKKLKIQGRIRAVGAGRNIGAGIRFLNVNASSITSVEGKTQSTNGNKVALSFESGQKYPVIILCDDAHKFCGNPDGDKTFFCTDPSASSQYNTGDGANFEVTMEFNSEAEAQKAYAINNIDVFIINRAASKDISRTEVHVAGYAPTDVANMSQFGTANDASKPNANFNSPAKGNYISIDGLAWGICIPLIKGSNDQPNVWAWPRETSIITAAYPQFKTWITSNGADAKDWATHPSGHIFVKPSN